MCITSGLCDAGDLFIQVILLLSSPGETPLTYQAASAYLLSFAFNLNSFYGFSADPPLLYLLPCRI
jgi:hypothetical protein